MVHESIKKQKGESRQSRGSLEANCSQAGPGLAETPLGARGLNSTSLYPHGGDPVSDEGASEVPGANSKAPRVIRRIPKLQGCKAQARVLSPWVTQAASSATERAKELARWGLLRPKGILAFFFFWNSAFHKPSPPG